jgi:hypothetical protein
MNISVMFRSAVEEFDARVRLIGDHQWRPATPDEDWSVRDRRRFVPLPGLTASGARRWRSHRRRV